MIVPISAQSYNVSGSGWAIGEANYHTSPLSTSGSGLSSTQLQSAFIQALNEWTSNTNFKYVTTGGSANPCAIPSVNPANNDNGYTFASTSCGTSFGPSTLAFATTWRLGVEGDGAIIQSGIAFNSNKNWSIYSGPQGTNTSFDFRRTAVHELGHSLGLSHSQFSSAIMWDSVSDTEEPQNDDINGVASLYAAFASPVASMVPIIMLLLDDD